MISILCNHKRVDIIMSDKGVLYCYIDDNLDPLKYYKERLSKDCVHIHYVPNRFRLPTKHDSYMPFSDDISENRKIYNLNWDLGGLEDINPKKLENMTIDLCRIIYQQDSSSITCFSPKIRKHIYIFGTQNIEHNTKHSTHERDDVVNVTDIDEPETLLPSTTCDKYWIISHNKNSPREYIDSGKWMIFVKKNELDKWWLLIKEKTEQGELGPSSKTSTMLGKPNDTNTENGAIMVYTYDYNDIDDIKRVLTTLRKIGVTQKIYYKTNEMTRNNRYSKLGHNASKYNSDELEKCDDVIEGQYNLQNNPEVNSSSEIPLGKTITKQDTICIQSDVLNFFPKGGKKVKITLISNRNSGKKWSDEEVELLKINLHEGMELYDIAHKLGRVGCKGDEITPVRNKFVRLVNEGIIDNMYHLLANEKYIPLLSSLHSNNNKLHITDSLPDMETCLIFDTEYTNDQHLIEIYWEIRKIKNGKITRQQYYLVNQKGVMIDNSDIHHITNELVEVYGKSIIDVLKFFDTDVDNVDVIISHGFNSADYITMIKEHIRNGLAFDKFHNKPYTDTLKLSQMKYKGISYKLGDLYEYLFKQDIERIHTAIGDTSVCSQIYYKMVHDMENIEINHEITRPFIVQEECVDN